MELAKTRNRSSSAGGGTWRSLLEDLKALGWTADYMPPGKNTLAVTVERLIGELAVLSEIADGNQSHRTDAEGKYRDVHSPMPRFDAAGAQRALDEAERRLWREYERLSGKSRRPADGAAKRCDTSGCQRRVLHRLEEDGSGLCGPCANEILSRYRRQGKVE